MTKIPQDQLADINVAAIDPTVADDSSLRYGVGSKWFNTVSQAFFICEVPTVGAALWTAIPGAGTGTVSGTGTDNHLARWDGVNNIQDSGIILGDITDKNAILDISLLAATDKTFTFPNLTGTFVLTTPNGNSNTNTSWFAGNAISGNNQGGDITIGSGSGFGTGVAGSVYISSASGGSGTDGGQINFTSGNGANNGNGGNIIFSPGVKNGTGIDGKVIVYGPGGSFGAILDASLIVASDKTFILPNASGTFAVSASGNIALSALGDITFNGTLPIANGGTSGTTYTPALTNTTNITSSTAKNCTFTRSGSVVTVFGSVDLTTTLAIASVLEISLPIASNIGVVTDLNGIAQASSAIAGNAYLEGEVTNNTAALKFIGLSVGGAGTLYFSFAYSVI